MPAADPQDPATTTTTGGGDGGSARRVKNYCDKAVANLKAGRLEEAYLYANEALELDKNDAKAAALRRYALYALHPMRRLLDKAKALSKEADRCTRAGDCIKALELLSLAKTWRCTPGILSLRAVVNLKRKRYDLAYLDTTEALTGQEEGTVIQEFCLLSLGFKTHPMIVSQQRRVDELRASSRHVNRPKGIRVKDLLVDLQEGFAQVKMSPSHSLRSIRPVPIDQLARFLDNHVKGAVENLIVKGGDDGLEDAMLRLLDEVTVPERLHVYSLVLDSFFHLPWAGIKRILDGRILRADVIHFPRLQLPGGVDANELLKLPAIRECTHLTFQPYTVSQPQLPGPTPLLNNAALVEWTKWSADGRERTLRITREYLSSGLLGFLDALKKDFRQAARAHSYNVLIQCPNFDVADGLGVRDEQLSNRLGERMAIVVGECPIATALMGHRFETVKVERLPSTAG